MTVIAYRDGTLAGDSAWTDSGLVTAFLNKLSRLPSGVLYGGAGDSDDRELVALLSSVNTPADIPSRDVLRNVKADCSALLVFPSGEVWSVCTGEVEGGAEPMTPPCAIGSGRDLAIGAMLAGKSAAEACALACKRNVCCREPIHTLSLENNEATSKVVNLTHFR